MPPQEALSILTRLTIRKVMKPRVSDVRYPEIPAELTENIQDLRLDEPKSRSSSPQMSETDNEDIQRRLDAVEAFYVSVVSLAS